MSGVFGIFNRNERSIKKKTLNTMLDAVSYWNPDERDVWTNGPVALGHTMLWNTPESKYEHLPVEKNDYVLTMDARIDNRDELMKTLELPDLPMEKIGDSEFILAAYHKWGAECPKHLLGDFVFAIWDEQKKEIFCARDHVGVKSFYYYIDENIFIFSNDIRGIIVHNDVSQTIDDLKMLYYLIDEYHPSLTFFKFIKKLEPASTLIVNLENYEKSIYWKAENSPIIKLATIDEYANKLNELIEKSVIARTRSIYPIASHLSGGLDSSTIAVVANRNLKNNNHKLYTYNWVPSPKMTDNMDYYEWNNSRKISEIENISHVYVELNEKIVSDIYLNKNIITDNTECIEYENIVRKKAKTHNVRTILSGWGGDELITYNGRVFYTELFWKRNPIYALYKLYKEESGNKRRYLRFLKLCYRQFLMPIIKKFKKESYLDEEYFNFLNSNFLPLAKNNCIAKKSLSEFSTRENQLSLFHLGHIVNRIESWTSSSFADKIEYSYPLLDKRIVEFALGIPSELYRMHGYGRYLFRYTVKDILPDEIRWNNVKSEPHRVDLLLEITLLAKVKLMNDMKSNGEGSRYVNFDKLQNLISDTQLKWEEKTMEEKVEALELIHKLTMIYNIKMI